VFTLWVVVIQCHLLSTASYCNALQHTLQQALKRDMFIQLPRPTLNYIHNIIKLELRRDWIHIYTHRWMYNIYIYIYVYKSTYVYSWIYIIFTPKYFLFYSTPCLATAQHTATVAVCFLPTCSVFSALRPLFCPARAHVQCVARPQLQRVFCPTPSIDGFGILGLFDLLECVHCNTLQQAVTRCNTL